MVFFKFVSLIARWGHCIYLGRASCYPMKTRSRVPTQIAGEVRCDSSQELKLTNLLPHGVRNHVVGCGWEHRFGDRPVRLVRRLGYLTIPPSLSRKISRQIREVSHSSVASSVYDIIAVLRIALK